MTRSSTLKAVLFDLDDTLSFTNRDVYRQAATWVSEHFGLDPRDAATAMVAQWKATEHSWQHLRTLEDEVRFWDEYAEQLATRMGLTPRDAREIVREWPFERFMTPVRGAREVLGELRTRGLKVGVLSNTLPNVDKTLQALGFHDLVDVAIASCTLGAHKPDARAFLASAERLGLEPHEVLFVDDKFENVQAARALRMPALLIDHGGTQPDAIHTLEEVLEAV